MLAEDEPVLTPTAPEFAKQKTLNTLDAEYFFEYYEQVAHMQIIRLIFALFLSY